MASVDDLFKKPTLAASKRKLELAKDPDKLYKAARLDSDSDVKSKDKRFTVEDETQEDGYTGPELPSDFQIEDPSDDEEGRFFGGGMEHKAAQAMQYIDEQDAGETTGTTSEKFDSAWVRRLALSFERRISKNAELRGKFENDPQKFMASEADLDTEIKGLSILSEHPGLYHEFSKMGCVGSLVSLLTHENADIAIDAIQIMSELTDEDVEAQQEQWDSLVNAMLDADAVELLVQNLSRLDESSDIDRAGVYYVLSVLENLASQISIAERVGQNSTLLSWLLSRIQYKEAPLSQNKQYTSEILAILLQSSPKNKQKFMDADGINILLQLLSQYRKRDPEKDSNEGEYVENLFDCLTCLVDEETGKNKFLEAEGVELAQIMMREGKFSKYRALRVLDHAMSGHAGAPVCERLIEVAGLRTIFGMFMKKQEHRATEHLLGIFASLLRLLPGESAARIRTLAKFMEKDYEKVNRLLELRRGYSSRVSPVEEAIKKDRVALSKEDQNMMEDEWLSRRFDAGLFSLQLIDVILAWLVAEDDGAKRKITTLLADYNEDLSLLRATLQEQMEGLKDEELGQRDLKDMLGILLQFLN